MGPQYTLIRIYLFVCQRKNLSVRRPARQSGPAAKQQQRDPEFTDKEVLTSATASCVFGPAEKRTTISEIHLCVEDHFSGWFPGSARAEELQSPPGPAERRFCSAGPRSPLGSQLPKDLWRDDSRRRLDADLCGEGAAGLTGKRGFGSTRLGRLLLSVSPLTARELHLVVERRPGQLPVPKRAGLTPGSENDLRALRRVLPTIEGGGLCGDKACCDGPIKERLRRGPEP